MQFDKTAVCDSVRNMAVFDSVQYSTLGKIREAPIQWGQKPIIKTCMQIMPSLKGLSFACSFDRTDFAPQLGLWNTAFANWCEAKCDWQHGNQHCPIKSEMGRTAGWQNR